MFGLFKNKKKIINNTINTSWNSKFKALVRMCNELNTDLIEMTEHHPTCAECAMYQGRVYSISGKSRNFPPVPDVIKIKGQVHSKCRHNFYPFHEGNTPTYHKNIIEYSNRPFIDDRSEDEINEYETQKKQERDLKRDKAEYEKICNKLPDQAPKSFAGYRKMKNLKSDNFKNLKNTCKSVGIIIKD